MNESAQSARTGLQLSRRKLRNGVRQFSLLLSMLVISGWPVFPRNFLVVCLLVCCIAALSLQRKSILRRSLPVLLLPVAVALVMLFRSFDEGVLSLVSRFVNFISAFLLLNVYLNEESDVFRDDLYFILRLMAFQAIATSILANTVSGLFTTVTGYGTPYQTIGLLLNYHVTNYDRSFFRPDGFFFEAGVFQLYLNLFLYLALFEKRDVRGAILGFFSVLSLYSTTGMIILSGLVAAYFLKGGVKRLLTRQRGRQVPLAIVAVGAIAVLVPLFMFARSNVAEKVSGDRQGSFLARQFDTYQGLRVIANHPVFGIGFTKEAYLEAKDELDNRGLPQMAFLARRDTSNGVVSLVYAIGIPLSMFFIVGLYRQRMLQKRLIVFLLFFISLQSEKIFLTPLILMICFSGLVPNRKTPRPSSSDQPVEPLPQYS
jgi:hypothetical protein